MPFTPYHFGPSGLVGLSFRKWIDLPVFVLANVIVDLEVVFIGKFGLGQGVHRYFHTLLLGAAVGIVWGLLAYHVRGIFKRLMGAVGLAYETSLLKMIISGILGVWVHVVVDAVYHWDVRLFWPGKARPLYNLLSKGEVERWCLICAALAVLVYVFLVLRRRKKRKAKTGV